MPLININNNTNDPVSAATNAASNQSTGNSLPALPQMSNVVVGIDPKSTMQVQNNDGVQEYSAVGDTMSKPIVADPGDQLQAKIQNLNNVMPGAGNPVASPVNQPTIVPASNDVGTINVSMPKEELIIPPESTMDFKLSDILQMSIDRGASDVHLSVGNKARLRVDGQLVNISTEILEPNDLLGYVKEFTSGRKDVVLDEINEFDMGYGFKDRRFRVNIFRQSGNFAIVARMIPNIIKTPDELGVPAILKEFTKVSSGLLLITGPTGSGKSTTIASLLNYINLARAVHIVTIEDPIEFIFPKAVALVNQREFGQDFKSWDHALRAILRQDPNIVLVGEMRDLQTISSAITLSETGHLVFGTLHTNSASQTMDRIIDVFPEGQQPQIRAQLANVLSGVVAQRLVPLINGGRRSVMEVLVANSAVRNLIREGKTHQIDNVIQTGQDLGMISMTKTLVEYVNKGLITVETARSYANNINEFNMLMGKS